MDLFFARIAPHTGLLENNRWLLIWGLCHISSGADGGYAFLAATCMGVSLHIISIQGWQFSDAA